MPDPGSSAEVLRRPNSESAGFNARHYPSRVAPPIGRQRMRASCTLAISFVDDRDEGSIVIVASPRGVQAAGQIPLDVERGRGGRHPLLDDVSAHARSGRGDR